MRYNGDGKRVWKVATLVFVGMMLWLHGSFSNPLHAQAVHYEAGMGAEYLVTASLPVCMGLTRLFMAIILFRALSFAPAWR